MTNPKTQIRAGIDAIDRAKLNPGTFRLSALANAPSTIAAISEITIKAAKTRDQCLVQPTILTRLSWPSWRVRKPWMQWRWTRHWPRWRHSKAQRHRVVWQGRKSMRHYLHRLTVLGNFGVMPGRDTIKAHKRHRLVEQSEQRRIPR